MRGRYRCLLIGLAWAGSFVHAQEKRKTDAETDGLAGPVQYAITTSTKAQIPGSGPDGRVFVGPIRCNACAYDRDGNRTLSGGIQDGRFIGDIMSYTRDGEGHIIARTRVSDRPGSFLEQEVIGPFGEVASTVYRDGKLEARQTFDRDPKGNLIEWSTVNGEGMSLGRSEMRYDADGHRTRETAWSGGHVLVSQDTYDPATDEQHLTLLEETGEPKLTFVYRKGEMLSFWQSPEMAEAQGSYSVLSAPDGADRYVFDCKSSSCDRWRQHTAYLDGSKHNIKSIERVEPDGHTSYGGYVEYELDAHDNWTLRRIWITSPGTTERTLYETDLRTVAYWDK
jgi:hypothetical protein